MAFIDDVVEGVLFFFDLIVRDFNRRLRPNPLTYACTPPFVEGIEPFSDVREINEMINKN